MHVPAPLAQVCMRLPQHNERECGAEAMRAASGGKESGGEWRRVHLPTRLSLLRRCCANLQARTLVLSLPSAVPLRDACAKGTCDDDRCAAHACPPSPPPPIHLPPWGAHGR